MRILITAGNTIVPVDRVRCLTNIFTGRTGAQIALHACRAGHKVCLLTSRPETVTPSSGELNSEHESLVVRAYRTFQDLQGLMEETVVRGAFDAVIHCAAVNDYEVTGIYAPAIGTSFQPATGQWLSEHATSPTLIDRAAGKVKSDEPELWLRLARSVKLVDRIRRDWGFRGILVKFKLEVGLGTAQLLEVAERSRRHSDADLMVANTLEGSTAWALLGPFEGLYRRVTRDDLPAELLAAVEGLHRERGHA